MSEQQPELPEGVRVIYPDGREVPLECRYEGVDKNGLHVWMAVLVVPHEDGMRLAVSTLPSRTRILMDLLHQ